MKDKLLFNLEVNEILQVGFKNGICMKFKMDNRMTNVLLLSVTFLLVVKKQNGFFIIYRHKSIMTQSPKCFHSN